MYLPDGISENPFMSRAVRKAFHASLTVIGEFETIEIRPLTSLSKMKFLPVSLPRVFAMSMMSASGKLKSLTISFPPSPVSASTWIAEALL